MNNIDNIITLVTGTSLVIAGIIIRAVLVIGILYIIGLWKLFKKAGKNGWEAIIPFYNIWILIEISGLNKWYFLIAILGSITTTLQIDNISYNISFLTDIASAVVNFFIFYNLAKKMNQEPIGWAIGGLLIKPIIVIIWGLSGKYTYNPNIEVSINGPIGGKEVTIEKYCLNCGTKINNNTKFCTNCGKEIK